MADLFAYGAFSAFRHPDALSMDLYDELEFVKQACEQTRAMYRPVYKKLYDAGGMSKETGFLGRFPLWCKERDQWNYKVAFRKHLIMRKIKFLS